MQSIRYASKSLGGGILLLSNNRNSYCLYQWLRECNEQVYYYSGELTAGQIQFLSPRLIVSYNYGTMVSERIIQMAEGRMINLHISYLPWNKGSDPNFWSFLEDTPKGVTIHQIDVGLDTGKILFQKECYFDPEKETFRSAYDKLNKEIVKLFKENWGALQRGEYILREQTGKGSYHSRQALQKLRTKINFEWSDPIAEFLKKYRAMEKE